MATVKIGDRGVGDGYPTYFIADISANHDGDLERAKALIEMAKEAGADAAKFQNFRAPKIVSQRGFETLDGAQSHQSAWKKSVVQVYVAASLPWDWTPILSQHCREAGIHYFSTPYDFDTVDMLDPYVSVYKIGSGDITWPEMLLKVAGKRKPVILATGASDMGEVQKAVATIRAMNSEVVLLQCNTNYTGSQENFKHIHLNVLRTYKTMYPDLVVGLSDHTAGHTTALGAVALGARVVEKHFTDDTSREGPDHPFSMTPSTWREMVERTRELEYALGGAIKQVDDNERETVVVQRRCLRASRDLKAGTILSRDMIDVLRPAPRNSVPPFEVDRLIGKRLRVNVPLGEDFRWSMLEPTA